MVTATEPMVRLVAMRCTNDCTDEHGAPCTRGNPECVGEISLGFFGHGDFVCLPVVLPPSEIRRNTWCADCGGQILYATEPA